MLDVNFLTQQLTGDIDMTLSDLLNAALDAGVIEQVSDPEEADFTAEQIIDMEYMNQISEEGFDYLENV